MDTQHGTLSIRLIIESGGHSRPVTIYRINGVTRPDCETQITLFFADNPHICQKMCVIEWAYKDYL